MSLSETTKYVAAVGAASEEKVTFRAMNAKGEHQDVCGIKANLMLASPVLRSMLSENWRQHHKVEIANFQAETLQLLVEFVENFQLVSSVSCQDLVKLVVAADYFMIKSLVQYCIKTLGPRVGVCDVWLLLDTLCIYEHLDTVLSTCVPVLQKKTGDCLSHPSFLLARHESLVFLLKQDTLNLKSEHHLLYHCWRWSLQQPSPQSASRELLPYLRLNAEFKGRMEWLIDLKPTNDDFAAQFDLKIAVQPAQTRICSNSRMFTSGDKRVALRKRCNLKIPRDENGSLVISPGFTSCSVSLTAKTDILLVSIWLPTLYEVHPIWEVVEDQVRGQYYEHSEPEYVDFRIVISINDEVSEQHCKFPLCFATSTKKFNEVKLASPRQLLKCESLSIRCQFGVSKICKAKKSKLSTTPEDCCIKVNSSGSLVAGLTYYVPEVPKT